MSLICIRCGKVGLHKQVSPQMPICDKCWEKEEKRVLKEKKDKEERKQRFWLFFLIALIIGTMMFGMYVISVMEFVV